MRLKKIKLAGFKSFVDPTTIHLPTNLIGIVGPNGCGKSNVIDAVRWVMGESSAKFLRGDSMADVIFNGSSARKPVGQAFIELVFDNGDGSFGGQFARYAEISVKRQVSRDGLSQYFLNGTRCRRRDITDVFLGTGLGPRSYSIIEQGTISRLIDAKPEELRAYLEEAAGISKYKERRRETENRMQHTRENLERLEDLREEVAKLLQHLQRQAKTAARFKALKEEERLLKAQLLALRWRGLDIEDKRLEQSIHEQETRQEAAVAAQRAEERRIEESRVGQIESNDAFNQVQGRYYSVGAEIARIEQAIQHAKDTEHRQQHELGQVEKAWQDAQAHIHSDQQRLNELDAQLLEASPELAAAQQLATSVTARLGEVEEAMRTWQARWEDYTRRAAEPMQMAEVERTRIQHLDQQLLRARSAVERGEQERQGLSWTALEQEIGVLEAEQAAADSQGAVLEEQIKRVGCRIGELRERSILSDREIHGVRTELQHTRGRHASVEALQQAALGQGKGVISAWLERHGLQDAPRLAEELRVERGWERAVETVLGPHLEAVCVSGIDPLQHLIAELTEGSVGLVEAGPGAKAPPAEAGDAQPLLCKVTAAWRLDGLLAGVYAAEDLPHALTLRDQLPPSCSVVTRDGLWIGAGWLRVSRVDGEEAGILEREQERRQLTVVIQDLERRAADLERVLDTTREQLREQERGRDELQRQINQHNSQRADTKVQLVSKRSQLEQVKGRGARLARELAEAREQIGRDEQALREARGRLNTALEQMAANERDSEDLQGQRAELDAQLDEHRARAGSERDAVHRIALGVESMRSARSSTAHNLERMQGQLAHLSERRQVLQESLKEGIEPHRALAVELDQLLQRRMGVEAELGEARRHLEEVEARLRQLDQQRVAAERKVNEVRSGLDALRMQWQGVHVRRQTVEEQVAETGHELSALFEELPQTAQEAEWQHKVEALEQRLQRLGPINLAAIDEFQEQSERMQYLDAQYADLTESLRTLENAIHKIDRETRTRFRETFDKVNGGLKDMFPRLFGGGHAFLELTGSDLLDTGVTVMARPPGKRISTIHLLSGGEKALAAVALVFAIFQLNPAPFCLLDEVDAPLDEANVSRYCDLVKMMSERIQFVFITHNKTTMEMANQLTGVTMHEPGVSRLVAVDVDDAVQMAAG